MFKLKVFSSRVGPLTFVERPTVPLNTVQHPSPSNGTNTSMNNQNEQPIRYKMKVRWNKPSVDDQSIVDTSFEMLNNYSVVEVLCAPPTSASTSTASSVPLQSLMVDNNDRQKVNKGKSEKVIYQAWPRGSAKKPLSSKKLAKPALPHPPSTE